jgi:hypothetical protein
MDKVIFFAVGVAAGYMLNKVMNDSGGGSIVPSEMESTGGIGGRRKWVHVDAYPRRWPLESWAGHYMVSSHKRHYPGMAGGMPVHTVILPPGPAAPQNPFELPAIGATLGLM